jgi:hypothetical protein
LRRILELVAFVALVVLVALRPLVAETYDSALTGFDQALATLDHLSPARTVVFDMIILGSAMLWSFTRRPAAGHAYRWTGLEFGLGLVLIAAIASSALSGNKRLAINASLDWVSMALMAVVLAQLMRARWQRRLLLAAILATGCVQSYECYEQYTTGFAETWEHYQSIKAEFWADQNVPPDSSRIESFEARLKAREASGTMPHSNVAGSYLMLVGFAALGAAQSGWKTLRRSMSARGVALVVAQFAIALALLGAMALTGSKAAIAASVIGAALWLLIGLARPWIARHPVRSFAIGWAMIVLAGVAVVGHGLYHGSLPGASLNFRWQYWTASRSMIADHPLGVGRENFGRHYLRYKSIESPEEVSNPHNLLVHAACEWGVLGLVGVVLMLVGSSWVASRCVASTRDDGGNETDEPDRLVTMAAAIFVAAVVIVARGLLLGSSEPNYVYYVTVAGGLAWLAGFLPFWFGGLGSLERVGAASRPDEGVWSASTTGLTIGLFAFLLTEMVNFALFVPAAAMTFFALLAVRVSECAASGAGRTNAVAMPTPQRPSARVAVGRMGMPAGLLVLVGGLGFMWGEVISGNNALRRARQLVTYQRLVPDAPSLSAEFQRAAMVDPFDPTPHEEDAALWMRVWISRSIPSALDKAEQAISAAIDRDPYDLGLRRMRWQVLLARARHTKKPADFNDAIAAAKDALALYPLDPDGLVTLGDTLAEAASAIAGTPAARNALLLEAIDAYQQALDLDAARPAWVHFHRLTAQQRAALSDRVTQLRERLTAP